SAEPGVERATAYLEGEAVLRTDDDEVQGVRLRGLEAGDPRFPPTMRVHFEEGEDWSSLQAKGEELPGILLGREMAASLGIVPALLEEVDLLYPFGTVGPTGEVEPNVRRFRVVGTFRSGYFEYDNKFAIAALPELQRLFGDHASVQVGVYFADPGRSALDRQRFQSLPGVAETSTWHERNARLFSALKLERLGMIVVLSLMSVLASFNILCMLMLVVFERRRDLALLKALGLSEPGISGIFYRAGFWIGAVGGLLGLGGGLFLAWAIRVAKIRPPAPYYLETFPVDLQPGTIALTLLLALLLSLAAAVLPAREGRKMTVIEALRYE
ncbi:MAG TPA: FtsX-like permease family protein, partial [bacterium]|nr:FtsX-like permease family protein [bacterium]